MPPENALLAEALLDAALRGDWDAVELLERVSGPDAKPAPAQPARRSSSRYLKRLEKRFERLEESLQYAWHKTGGFQPRSKDGVLAPVWYDDTPGLTSSQRKRVQFEEPGARKRKAAQAAGGASPGASAPAQAAAQQPQEPAPAAPEAAAAPRTPGADAAASAPRPRTRAAAARFADYERIKGALASRPTGKKKPGALGVESEANDAFVKENAKALLSMTHLELQGLREHLGIPQEKVGGGPKGKVARKLVEEHFGPGKGALLDEAEAAMARPKAGAGSGASPAAPAPEAAAPAPAAETLSRPAPAPQPAPAPSSPAPSSPSASPPAPHPLATAAEALKGFLGGKHGLDQAGVAAFERAIGELGRAAGGGEAPKAAPAKAEAPKPAAPAPAPAAPPPAPAAEAPVAPPPSAAIPRAPAAEVPPPAAAPEAPAPALAKEPRAAGDLGRGKHHRIVEPAQPAAGAPAKAAPAPAEAPKPAPPQAAPAPAPPPQAEAPDKDREAGRQRAAVIDPRTRKAYEALKIPFDATEREIQKAYNDLALKLHPDRNPGNAKAQKAFSELGRARRAILSFVQSHAAASSSQQPAPQAGAPKPPPAPATEAPAPAAAARPSPEEMAERKRDPLRRLPPEGQRSPEQEAAARAATAAAEARAARAGGAKPAAPKPAAPAKPAASPAAKPANPEAVEKARRIAKVAQYEAQSGENYMDGGVLANMMVDDGRIPKEVGRQFQAHGAEVDGVLSLLAGGVDPSRPFHSEWISGQANSHLLRDAFPFMVVGGKGDPKIAARPGGEGIGFIAVDSHSAPAIPALREAYPGVAFVPAAEMPDAMKALAAGKPLPPGYYGQPPAPASAAKPAPAPTVPMSGFGPDGEAGPLRPVEQPAPAPAAQPEAAPAAPKPPAETLSAPAAPVPGTKGTAEPILEPPPVASPAELAGHYGILGLSPEATPAEAREAYRRLSLPLMEQRSKAMAEGRKEDFREADRKVARLTDAWKAIREEAAPAPPAAKPAPVAAPKPAAKPAPAAAPKAAPAPAQNDIPPASPAVAAPKPVPAPKPPAKPAAAPKPAPATQAAPPPPGLHDAKAGPVAPKPLPPAPPAERPKADLASDLRQPDDKGRVIPTHVPAKEGPKPPAPAPAAAPGGMDALAGRLEKGGSHMAGELIDAVPEGMRGRLGEALARLFDAGAVQLFPDAGYSSDGRSIDVDGSPYQAVHVTDEAKVRAALAGLGEAPATAAAPAAPAMAAQAPPPPPPGGDYSDDDFGALVDASVARRRSADDRHADLSSAQKLGEAVRQDRAGRRLGMKELAYLDQNVLSGHWPGRTPGSAGHRAANERYARLLRKVPEAEFADFARQGGFEQAGYDARTNAFSAYTAREVPGLAAVLAERLGAKPEGGQPKPAPAAPKPAPVQPKQEPAAPPPAAPAKGATPEEKRKRLEEDRAKRKAASIIDIPAPKPAPAGASSAAAEAMRGGLSAPKAIPKDRALRAGLASLLADDDAPAAAPAEDSEGRIKAHQARLEAEGLVAPGDVSGKAAATDKADEGGEDFPGMMPRSPGNAARKRQERELVLPADPVARMQEAAAELAAAGGGPFARGLARSLGEGQMVAPLDPEDMGAGHSGVVMPEDKSGAVREVLAKVALAAMAKTREAAQKGKWDEEKLRERLDGIGAAAKAMAAFMATGKKDKGHDPLSYTDKAREEAARQRGAERVSKKDAAPAGPSGPPGTVPLTLTGWSNNKGTMTHTLKVLSEPGGELHKAIMSAKFNDPDGEDRTAHLTPAAEAELRKILSDKGVTFPAGTEKRLAAWRPAKQDAPAAPAKPAKPKPAKAKGGRAEPILEPSPAAAKAAHDDPAVESAFGDAYRKLAASGAVEIPELVDAMKAASPGLTTAQAHAALRQWQKEDRLTIQFANDRDLTRRPQDGIETPRGLGYYVLARDQQASAFPSRRKA